MREKHPLHDWFIVFVTIALLLIPLYLIPETPLFKPSIVNNASNYGFVIYIVLIFSFLLWAAGESKKGNFPKNVLTTLGFRWSKRQVAVGFIVGCFAGTAMWLIGDWFSSGILPTTHLVVSMLLAAPIVEEILFRGYLINRLLCSKRTLQMKMLAMIASVLIFSWMHASNPEQKVVGGIIFTGVYMWGWKNNMAAAIMTHAGANAMILFLGYSSLGKIVTIGTLAIIVAMISLLVLILWMAYPLTHILVRAFVKFLRRIPRMRRAKG